MQHLPTVSVRNATDPPAVLQFVDHLFSGVDGRSFTRCTVIESIPIQSDPTQLAPPGVAMAVIGDYCCST